MATRLIIEGNAVYEIDEDCQEYQRKGNGIKCRTRRREYRGVAFEENTEGKEEMPPCEKGAGFFSRRSRRCRSSREEG